MKNPPILPCVLSAVLLTLSCQGSVIDDPYAGGEDGSRSLTPSGDGGLPVSGDGTSTGSEVCKNGLDDDGDGQVDEDCACDAVKTPSQACYPGPAATRKVGACKDGTQQCKAGAGEFSTWGPCTGAVVPTKELCDQLDNDCNGKVDDVAGCVCTPGQTKACYTGPSATRHKGQCKDGKQTCNSGGSGWSGCVGQVLPSKELCKDKIDNDCDGQIDEGCIVTVNVNLAGDCLWAYCPSQAPYPVGCSIVMSGGDCRGCVATSGKGGVYFQEGNACGAGKVQGKLYCSSAPGKGLNKSNCIINKKTSYYPSSPKGCPALGSGDGC